MHAHQQRILDQIFTLSLSLKYSYMRLYQAFLLTFARTCMTMACAFASRSFQASRPRRAEGGHRPHR